MTANVDPKILQRITKLLRLSQDSGAAEGEAATAAEMAQRLMEEYNLSAAALETSTGAHGARTKTATKGKAAYKYQQRLMHLIAELNFCSLMVRSSWNGKRYIDIGYQMIGREVNVLVAQQLFVYLNNAIERALDPHMSHNGERMARWAMTFKEGVADRLIQRLRERAAVREREQATQARSTQASGGGMALVLTDYRQREVDENNDFAHGWEPGTTVRKRAENAVAHAAWLKQQEADADELVERHETPAQAAHRRERERRAEQRENERYWKEQQRRAEKYGSWAYKAGAEAGKHIGLDDQLKDGGSAPVRGQLK